MVIARINELAGQRYLVHIPKRCVENNVTEEKISSQFRDADVHVTVETSGDGKFPTRE